MRATSDPSAEKPDSGAQAKAAVEHFIPIRKSDLVRLLVDKRSAPGEREQFLQLCRLLEATFHFEYHERLEELKNAYAWFDPDADTHPRIPLEPLERDRQADLLFKELTDLLERANYARVSQERIKEALSGASEWGMNLRVDLEAFDRLEVFARGEAIHIRRRRRLRNLYRERQVLVPTYQRLVVAFRPKAGGSSGEGLDPDTVYFKVFKGIPKMDVEMLLPGSRVQMALLDRGRILLPALSGVAMSIHKVLTGALILAVAGTYEVLTFLGLVGGTVGYGVKSFLSYLRAKDKYQLTLTRSLYYQNLDNNAGVLYRLLDEAEEQEFRETILAYHLLLNDEQADAELRGQTPQQLDERAEAFLQEAVGAHVDFEVDDALAKLKRLGLAELRPDGRVTAVPMPEALRRLDSAWDGFFQYSGDAADLATFPRRAAG